MLMIILTVKYFVVCYRSNYVHNNVIDTFRTIVYSFVTYIIRDCKGLENLYFDPQYLKMFLFCDPEKELKGRPLKRSFLYISKSVYNF